MATSTVTLYVPALSMPFYLQSLSKTVIDKMVKIFKPAIKGKTIRLVSAETEVEKHDPELSMCFTKMVFPTKNLSLKAFRILFGDNRNFNIYLQDCATPEMRQVIKEVYDNFYISADRAKQITGENLLKDENRHYYYYSDYDLNPFYNIFFIISNNGPRGYFGSRYALYLGLPDCVRYPLNRLYGKENAPLNTVDDIDGALTIFSAESESMTALQSVENLAKSKLIDLTKAKFTQAEIKKLAKMIPVNEFFPETDRKEYAHLRLQWLLVYLVNANLILPRKSAKTSQSVHELLHTAWEKQPLSAELLSPLSFVNIKGLRKNMLFNSGITDQYRMTTRLLTQLKGGKWNDIQSILDLLHSGERATWRNTIFYPTDFDKMDIVNKVTDDEVYISESYRQLGVPLIGAIFFGLAAIGAVDIAYSDTKDSESPYMGLKYVRMTAFGAYLTGLMQTYEPPTIDTADAPGFQLDDTTLTIYSEPGNNLDTLMNQFAEQIGPRRFALTTQSFLRNCNVPEDVTAKIDEFKRLLPREIPPLWNAFFDMLKKKSRSVKREPVSGYYLFRIPSDDKELQRLLSTASEIRQYVIKAENYMILVKTEDYSRLKQLLKRHGYIL
ncbi:MAG: hypothetical protein K2L30_05345 [Duncaniella sp.]|nr:hypothetical protein [Duncaniella sp.]